MRRFVLVVGVAVFLVTPIRAAPSSPFAASAPRVYGVSIDPSDYLATVKDASVLAKTFVAKIEANGANTIYVNAYNVEYGAYYRTSYRYNEESEYGRQDFLGKLLSAAHARGIQVFASFYDHQHRGAWEAQPGWREKTASGGDYNPPVTDIQYYLSPGNPRAAAWWQSFLTDALERYPDLDGVELREPIINWWGVDADYNPAATRAFESVHPGEPVGGEAWRSFRQDTLTRFLKAEIALVHRFHRLVHVTSVGSTYPDGTLLTLAAEAREVGFDLDRLLAGVVKPDAVKVELIWQQWARLYGRVAFTPSWTRTAALSFLHMVGGRVPLVVHVELTDFGQSTISVGDFYRTLVAADLPAVAGVDFYSASLADRKHAWHAVKAVYGRKQHAPLPESGSGDRRVLVLYDEGGTNSRDRLGLARIEQAELLNLLGHYDVKWDSYPVDGYRRGGLAGYEAVFYEGSVYGNAPQAFVSDISVFDGPVVWIGQNLHQLRESGVRLPFGQRTQDAVTRYRQLRYRGVLLPAPGEVIPTTAGAGATVVARLVSGEARAPYILRASRFWYVAGSPFSHAVLADGTPNGRMLAFADLLNDVLGHSQESGSPRVYLRLDGIDPLASAARIEAAADAFAAQGVPFLLSVTPFYEDPAHKLRVSLSERPALAAALRYAVAHGGAIVLDGSTHQYRGETGTDAEFWDVKNGGGLAEDSEPYVRERIEAALEELWSNELHPLAWQTPASLATPFDYALFGTYFSTFVEQRTYGTWKGSVYGQVFPYTVASDVYGGEVIPANLGGVVTGKASVGAMVANARGLRTVRGATAVGEVSLATRPAVLAGLIRRLRALGYRFPDLYSAETRVQTSERVELTGSGRASLAVPSGWYLHERILDRAGRVASSSLDLFPSYSRPSRSFASVPRRGLLSLAVLSPAEGAALGQRATAPTPPPGGWWKDTLVVDAVFGAAFLGLTLLLGSYVLVRVRRAGGPP